MDDFEDIDINEPLDNGRDTRDNSKLHFEVCLNSESQEFIKIFQVSVLQIVNTSNCLHCKFKLIYQFQNLKFSLSQVALTERAIVGIM